MFPLLRFLTPSLIWNFPSKGKDIFITFDDGPIPEVTPWVLETLAAFNAKATFFCVGKNVKNNMNLYDKIIRAGHSTGNHTMNHLKGWKTTNEKYFHDINECKTIVASELFRPPYGRIKISQIKMLKKEFRIIMWNVLSKDYDTTLTGNDCFEIVKKKTGKGSVIVFHDSLKAEERLRIALPATLSYFSERGYSFKAIQ